MALYFFSGKGGVGKTHLSASMCHYLSGMKRRVLLVEFSKFAQYSEYFDRKIGFEPVELSKNFFASSWTGLDCLEEYVQKLFKSKKVVDLFFKAPLMKKFTEIAPGLKEIAVLGKITSDYREINFNTEFDDIVFDCPASGHFLSMLRVPESLKSTVGLGPMNTQCESILKTLKETKGVHFVLVEDGSFFSKVELEETRNELSEILEGRFIEVVENRGLDFPNTPAQNWIESSSKMAACWSKYKWASR
jgi:anion-transporting  ArsA/GET3 family ATPase